MHCAFDLLVQLALEKTSPKKKSKKMCHACSRLCRGVPLIRPAPFLSVLWDLDPERPMGSWRKAWRLACEVADVRYRLHDMRHTSRPVRSTSIL